MFIPPPSIEHEERTQFSPLKIPNQPRPIPPPTDNLQQIVERLSKLQEPSLPPPPPLKQNLSKKKQKSQEQQKSDSDSDTEFIPKSKPRKKPRPIPKPRIIHNINQIPQPIYGDFDYSERDIQKYDKELKQNIYVNGLNLLQLCSKDVFAGRLFATIRCMIFQLVPEGNYYTTGIDTARRKGQISLEAKDYFSQEELNGYLEIIDSIQNPIKLLCS